MLSERAFGVVFLGTPRTAEKNPSVLSLSPGTCVQCREWHGKGVRSQCSSCFGHLESLATDD